MDKEACTDEYIIRLVLNGDVDKFEFIVIRYQRHLFNIGMRLFKNEDESYDFSQEVFIKTFNKINTFKGTAPFKFWLTRLAYNHGINMIHAKKDEFALPEFDEPYVDKTPEDTHEQAEIKKVLLEEINKLPDKYKICLDMYFFSGLTYSEICKITGFPINTVKSHVLRAKRCLKDSLKGTIVEDYNEM